MDVINKLINKLHIESDELINVRVYAYKFI